MNIAIIGGGAAGLMAAVAAKESNPNAHVILIERNPRLGTKVAQTGGGRCNFTSAITDVRELQSKYPRGAKFLTKALHNFGPLQIRAWFEEHGLRTKAEPDNRVFPASDIGQDVVDVFERALPGLGVEVIRNAPVRGVCRTKSCQLPAASCQQFEITLDNSTEPLVVDRLIITTGGRAYRDTGSMGDGYSFAQAFGHRITKLSPSLSAFIAADRWPEHVAGVSWTKATLSVRGEQSHSVTGPFIFTHRGLSGPAVFAASAWAAHETAAPYKPLDLAIDFFPDDDLREMRLELDARIAEVGGRSLLNVIAEGVPRKLAEVALHETKVPGERHSADVSGADRDKVLGWLKAAPLKIVGRPAGEEFVTAGGIDLADVNPSTMESRIVPGVFFAGEVLDIDAVTGGFNLTAAWATGRIAGKSAAMPLET